MHPGREFPEKQDLKALAGSSNTSTLLVRDELGVLEREVELREGRKIQYSHSFALTFEGPLEVESSFSTAVTVVPNSGMFSAVD